MKAKKSLFVSYRNRTKCKPCTTFSLAFCARFRFSSVFLLFCLKVEGKENYETHVRFAVGNRFSVLQIFLLMHHYGVINIVLNEEVGNIYGFVLLCCSSSIGFRHFSDSSAFLGTFPVAAVDRQSEKLFSNYANRSFGSGSLTLQVNCACLTKFQSPRVFELSSREPSTCRIDGWKLQLNNSPTQSIFKFFACNSKSVSKALKSNEIEPIKA
jgi:hypothetical protein